ncbi:MAG TPA: hypothetical protein VIY28_00510 [Pseudonocardiaceae bacterium]
MSVPMDHCEQCGFSSDELGVDEIPDVIRLLGTAFRSRLDTGVHDAPQPRSTDECQVLIVS